MESMGDTKLIEDTTECVNFRESRKGLQSERDPSTPYTHILTVPSPTGHIWSDL